MSMSEAEFLRTRGSMLEQDVRAWRIRQLGLRGHRQPCWTSLSESERDWWRQQYQTWLDRGAPPLPN